MTIASGTRCLCDNRSNVRCEATHCDLATGPGAPGDANQCRTCWVRLGGDPRVKAGGGAAATTTPPPPPSSCAHLGKPTGELVLCPSCTGEVKLKVFACAVHDRCTPGGKQAPGLACCQKCPDYRAARPPAAPAATAATAEEQQNDLVQVACTADGIGDALLGLTACEGLTRQGKRVVYSLLGTKKKGAAWQLPFVRLFHGYETAGTTLLAAGGGMPTTRYPHETYDAQNRTRLARPRWEHYARACGTTAALPAMRPLSDEAIRWAQEYAGCVVLSPFSAYASRAWSLSHWLHLERLLSDATGRRCVILDGRTAERSRTRHFSGEVLRDEPAVRVAALLRHGADCFVGNDSGMAHLAGLLAVPSVVLCAQVKGDHVYGLYPTVQVLGGPLGCGGCHWQGAAGWHPVRCETLCANLQAITPEAVCEAVLAKLAAGRTLLDAQRLAVLAETARRCALLPGGGDFAELGVYRGGSARVIADAAPGKLLHLFDTFSGIPSDDVHGAHRKGEFAASEAEVRAYLAGREVALHAGEFPGSTTEGDGDEDHVRYSFVHVDGDTYQTTRAALLYFWPRLVEGGVLLLDDYGWKNCPGVERAVAEVLPGVRVERTAAFQARLTRPC